MCIKYLKIILVTSLPFSLIWFWAWVFTHELHSAYSLAASISCTYTVAIAAIFALWYVVNNLKE